jgi:preprotein translocase SecF subunit
LISIGSLLAHGGPKLSIDFTGGSFVEVRFDRPVDTAQLRAAMQEVGVGSAEIQKVGTENDYILRMAEAEVAAVSHTTLGKQVTDPFGVIKYGVERKLPGVGVELRRQETVGPKIGSELKGQATKAVLVALLLMLVYILIRFPGLSYAVCAVIALFHDVILTLGVLSILGREVSLTVLAALLTIAGYSINDTIVVYDRIREELKAHRREPLEKVINRSVNLTLSRTMLTGVTTIMAVIVLYFLGGTVIRDFALTMLIGILWGTYSSVFVASSLVVSWENMRAAREHRGRGARRPTPAAAKSA